MMNDKEVIKAIEKVNRERISLQNSKEYKIGSAVLNIIHALNKGKIKKIKEVTRNAFVSTRLKRYIHENKICLEEFDEKLIDNAVERPKVVVYSCIAGNYDKIHDPLILFPNIDYVLFQNTGNVLTNSSFKIKQIPSYINKYGPILANRYIKMHPFEFFSDYDFTIYIDGNIKIMSDICMYAYASKVPSGIAMHLHRARNCIYDEGKSCKILRKGNFEQIKKLLVSYRKEGFPEHFGMNECNMIVCDMRNNNAKNIMDLWWEELVRSKTLRDQICWPYALWKQGFTLKDVGNLGENIYLNPKLEIVNHE